ncbi:hypothetical protein [Spiroplasma endosymbiont of Aspidapion aeneum]|uniref:hypothetical protein n=1 Tax=Spiroplasma endosymbiont of Aspidapion aeneum TaxID=3066276 RepID=UPI00313D4458
MTKKDIKIQKKSRFKKYYGFFSAILSINKAWFICAIMMPVFLVIVFSFFYLDKKAHGLTWGNFDFSKKSNENMLSIAFHNISITSSFFFGVLYFTLLVTVCLFAYFLFFSQLKNKKFRFAIYSGLSRNEVFWVLVFTLFFYIFSNALITISITAMLDNPLYRNRWIGCWEIFNIYLNIWLFSLVIILGGYLLWNKSLVLYIVFLSIISFFLLAFAAIVRFDYFILSLEYIGKKEGGNRYFIYYATLLPENIVKISRYFPLIFSSMTSMARNTIENLINIIYCFGIGSLILIYLIYLNKKITL